MKKINAFLLIILTLLSSCVKTPLQIKETQEIQDAVKSTVKIYGRAIGIKKSISKETEEETETIEVEAWVGSGIVTKIDTKSNRSIILTANHVANFQQISFSNDEETISIFILQELFLKVETYDGKKCSAKLLSTDEKNDVAAIVADCLAGNPVEIAEKMPTVGERIIISGAPLGFHPKNLFIVVDGFYLGNADKQNEIFSAPVVSGMSGSAVLYNGKIISILSMRVGNYEHIAICSNFKDVQRIQRMAEAAFQ